MSYVYKEDAQDAIDQLNQIITDYQTSDRKIRINIAYLDRVVAVNVEEEDGNLYDSVVSELIVKIQQKRQTIIALLDTLPSRPLAEDA